LFNLQDYIILANIVEQIQWFLAYSV
jgi:hypothetical protein